MNTDGINSAAITSGYKYFIQWLENPPTTNERINVESNIKSTIAIASVGPANNGKT